MSFMWIGKKPANEASRGDARRPWSEPRIVRLRPGTAEYERARRALLGDEDA